MILLYQPSHLAIFLLFQYFLGSFESFMWITNNLWVIIYMLAICNLYSPLLLLLFSCSPELPTLWRIKMVAVDLVALLLTLKEMLINSASEILAVFLYQHKGFIISSQFNRSLSFYQMLFMRLFKWPYFYFLPSVWRITLTDF